MVLEWASRQHIRVHPVRLRAAETQRQWGPMLVLYGRALICLLFGPTWVLYGHAHIGKPVYIAHWAHMCLRSGPHTCHLWACPYTSHTGPTRACYLGPTHVFFGLVLMCLLSAPHMSPIWACTSHNWTHMGLLSVQCTVNRWWGTLYC